MAELTPTQRAAERIVAHYREGIAYEIGESRVNVAASTIAAIIDAESAAEPISERRQIRITKRSDDYHAHLDGNTEIWGYGPSVDAAIGSMIRAHVDVFGLYVWYGTQFDERAWKSEDTCQRPR